MTQKQPCAHIHGSFVVKAALLALLCHVLLTLWELQRCCTDLKNAYLLRNQIDATAQRSKTERGQVTPWREYRTWNARSDFQV